MTPHLKWRIMLRTVVPVATILAMGSATLTASAATAGPATAARHGSHLDLRLTTIHLKVSTLSASLRARLGKAAASPDDSVNAYMISNGAINLCLDANNAGPTAGQNGDRIQLWQCNYTLNQYWIPVNYGSGTAQELVNLQYQSMCLNANNAWPPAGGLGNGSPVQLWNCGVGGLNEAWLFDYWLNGTNGSQHLYLFDEVGGQFPTLDATNPGLGNGDQVQIWQPLDLSNQWWYEYSSIST
jgi:Ricin-type beta-trefoil lectin domain